MKIIRESFKKGMIYKLLGESLDSKTVPLTSIMTKNILYIEKCNEFRSECFNDRIQNELSGNN
jgi:hypothetical protein